MAAAHFSLFQTFLQVLYFHITLQMLIRWQTESLKEERQQTPTLVMAAAKKTPSCTPEFSAVAVSGVLRNPGTKRKMKRGHPAFGFGENRVVPGLNTGFYDLSTVFSLCSKPEFSKHLKNDFK